ncbi:MAGUK p55 subfamily member 5-like [Thrips palmi]|uniref:MAGUK p55 subfamily member 5-like n=1 Tax=Thrips palmi TaxID=161013 RepID=A0A6P9AFH6_THRPL|nr:MAGUK p55 subfamily member 5-like [Thrips palmi]
MRLIKIYWNRPRRSIVGSVSGSKAAEADLGLRMLAGDAIPLTRDYRAEPLQPLQPLQPLHREMAVDVPDSFIARSKTPPRYPPPRPVGTQGSQGVNGAAVKPVPPPRAHLRIEEDGRLVNRAPAPQLPARPPDNNNDPDKEPTKEQLTSIRKYQEQLRQRKAEEERQAAQTEFLNRSLRGSRKLQALQEPQPPAALPDKRAGVVNDGYSSADDADLEPELPVDDPAVVLHRIIGYGELVASIQRLQLQLKKTGNSTISGGGYSALEGQVAAVQTLLLSPAFGRALAVHNKVQEVSAQLHTQPDSQPVSSHAQGLLRDCLDVIQPCTLPEATELAELLTRYDIEGLLLAHDTLASHDIAVVSPTLSEVERSLPEEPPLLPPITPSHTPVHTTPAHVTTSINEEHIKIIKIEKTNEPLGATVRNEGDAVMIGRVVRGGAAEKTGLLHQGDEVLEVNGVAMRGKSVNEVCDILAAMTGTLTFFVVPAAKVALPPPPVRDALMHVRAHFDYDPEDDLFIPCRELGVSFQKGDVLHVISQEDPNWWQAYREGEEDQTLAGLIPSKSFQHQREAYKQASIATTDPKEKTKKASTLLCAKKNAKKKSKKKGYGSSYVDGNYPLYSSSTTDEYESEEILTYEEVALYYPRANHKRPVVLIGPPNIGRHELRQRLMEDSERFAAAIPHTSRARKESEVDGQDYHFITRQQFEADILARKFVEHGEYERAYYGTSLDAIRSVVAAGKICVLNLHPQSLRILRNSDLKPYVVLVAPPALEKLRQKKLRNGEAFKEEELKETIEKAREMEEKYGHMLDLVIINSDTERAFSQLLSEINSLEREPQWVPTAWVKQL